MTDLLSGDEEAVLLAQLEASATAQARRYAEDVDRLVRLERRSVRSGSTERGLEMELAGTLRIGQQAAALLLADARRLHHALPLTLRCLTTGALLLPQARTVLDETRHCSEPVAAAAERRVLAGLDRAELAGWTARRLRSRLRAAVLAAEAELEPSATAERERTARASRRVQVRPEADGMASLWALLPAEQLRTFTLGLDLLTARQREADAAAGVDRTADQRRADLLALLPSLALHALDGTTPPADGGHPGVVVHVHVPVATALGLSDEPGDLAGHGPISAATVRLLLPDARLGRVLVDAGTGQPLHVDGRTTAPASDRSRSRTSTIVARSEPRAAAPESRPLGAALTGERPEQVHRALREALLGMLDERPVLVDETPEPQYRPSRPLARLVRVRDQHCCAPGCSRPGRDDLDHRVPWPLGPTSAANLAPLSRRCHRAKTTSWSVARDPDGSHTWTSPVGRTYRVPPPWRPPPEPRVPRRPDAPLLPSPHVDGPADRGLTAELDARAPVVQAGPPRGLAAVSDEPPPF